VLLELTCCALYLLSFLASLVRSMSFEDVSRMSEEVTAAIKKARAARVAREQKRKKLREQLDREAKKDSEDTVELERLAKENAAQKASLERTKEAVSNVKKEA